MCLIHGSSHMYVDWDAKRRKKLCHKLFINSFCARTNALNEDTLERESSKKCVFFPKILSKQSKHTTTTSERNRCNIERHLLINGKRMSRERRKLLFKIWIFYTVSNSIQSIERRLHDIIFKCKS